MATEALLDISSPGHWLHVYGRTVNPASLEVGTHEQQVLRSSRTHAAHATACRRATQTASALLSSRLRAMPAFFVANSRSACQLDGDGDGGCSICYNNVTIITWLSAVHLHHLDLSCCCFGHPPLHHSCCHLVAATSSAHLRKSLFPCPLCDSQKDQTQDSMYCGVEYRCR